MNITSTHPTLVDAVWQKENALVRNILLAVTGSIALWISAKIQIPFYPVPLSMQSLVVLMIGMAFGWRLATATILLYLAEGLAGLPVFAGTPEKGISLAYMAGPTGGYLLGFIIAAAAVGWLAERGFDRNIFLTAVAMLIGSALIYLPGIAWLGSVVGWDKPILQWGMIPFLYGDVLKLVLAALLMPTLWKLMSTKTH